MGNEGSCGAVLPSAMMGSDGSERDRYTNIYIKLQMGMTYCTDEEFLNEVDNERNQKKTDGTDEEASDGDNGICREMRYGRR